MEIKEYVLKLTPEQKLVLLQMIMVAMDTKYDKAEYRALTNDVLDQFSNHHPQMDDF